METKHTPEPWRISTANPYAVNAGRADQSLGICITHGVDDPNYSDFFPSTEQAKANAQRIVACVNACKGINPEVVPELSEVLCIALTDLEQAQKETHIDFRGSIDAIRAVLAKATK